MNKILFINACARPDSRTLRLSKVVLEKLRGEVKEINLYKEDIKPVDNDVINMRDNAYLNNDFSNFYFKYAKDFKETDAIVIAAPFWDLSFPSVLKLYFENIMVDGLTFKYLDDGSINSLCKIKKLIYVVTSGGFIPKDNYAFNYVEALSKEFFKIKETLVFKAEGLDIYREKEEEILNEAISVINKTLIS